MHDATRLEAIRERHNRATPEPWECDEGNPTGLVFLPSIDYEGGGRTRTVVCDRIRDAAFIAHARSDIPWLLERYDTLRAALAAAEAGRDALREAAETALGIVVRSDLKGKVPREIITVLSAALTATPAVDAGRREDGEQ